MTAQHTPGPWELQKPLFGEQHIYVHSENSVDGKVRSGRQHICVVPYEGKKGAMAYHEMFNANARLIAAAPDLLEALQAAVECGMVPTSSVSEGGASKHSRQVQVADMIRAAIARATHKEQT